jgi:hypothetical protein
VTISPASHFRQRIQTILLFRTIYHPGHPGFSIHSTIPIFGFAYLKLAFVVVGNPLQAQESCTAIVHEHCEGCLPLDSSVSVAIVINPSMAILD